MSVQAKAIKAVKAAKKSSPKSSKNPVAKSSNAKRPFTRTKELTPALLAKRWRRAHRYASYAEYPEGFFSQSTEFVRARIEKGVTLGAIAVEIDALKDSKKSGKK